MLFTYRHFLIVRYSLTNIFLLDCFATLLTSIHMNTYLTVCLFKWQISFYLPDMLLCCAVLCACAGIRRGRWGVRGSERGGSYLVWCVAEDIYHHTYKTNINRYLMKVYTCMQFTFKQHFISVVEIWDWTAQNEYCPQGLTFKYNIQCKTTFKYNFHLFKIIVSKIICKNFL